MNPWGHGQLNNSNRRNMDEENEINTLRNIAMFFNNDVIGESFDMGESQDVITQYMQEATANHQLGQYGIPPNVQWHFQMTPATHRVYHATVYYKGIALN